MVSDARKAFFSEEKNQKTFSDAVADLAGGTNTCIRKSLLLLFFRKEGLACCVPISDSAEWPIRIVY
jgi:hypothetical protein